MSGTMTATCVLFESKRANPNMLSAVSAAPVVHMKREPSRSPSQPPSGARQTITSEKKIIVRPTRVGVTWRMP